MEIPGYEELYYIEPNGDIYSMDRTVEYKDGRVYFYEGQLIKPIVHNAGYYQVNLCKNGTKKNYYIHRLLAETYIPNPNNYPCVNHKDCNRQNNDLNNLEWCTIEYNSQSINTTRNFGQIYLDSKNKKSYIADYKSNKVRHRKCFNTREEAEVWLENEKNNIINSSRLRYRSMVLQNDSVEGRIVDLGLVPYS